MAPEEKALLLELARSRVTIERVAVAGAVDAFVRSRYPEAAGPHPLVIEQPETYGLGCNSFSWRIFFSPEGSSLPASVVEAAHAVDLKGISRWTIDLSARAPVLTAVEMNCSSRGWVLNPETPPALQDFCRSACSLFDLRYLDFFDLRRTVFDPEVLGQAVLERLDHTERPNAYQLLFEED